ncbi:MAG TPA: hypothetical protein VN282_04795 [Pyrinomonadaceae bacterium]|nr:hypothetical protein [Pyrinomonadaceae bacterium]
MSWLSTTLAPVIRPISLATVYFPTGAGLASYVEQGGEARNFLKRKMSARGQSFRLTPKAERGRLAA